MNQDLVRQISTLVHDLRNPLTSVLGYGELAQGESQESVRRDYLDIVLAKSRLMARILEQYSEVCYWHAEGTCPLIVPQLLDLDALARTVLDSLGLDTGVLRFPRGESPNLQVTGDKTRLKKILTELLQNALIHGGAAGLTMEIAPAEKAISITISDTGPGIPEEVMKNLGQPFNRSRSQGQGLGLAWCLVNSHCMGGGLEISSESNRTVVRLHLPVNQ